MTAFLWGILAAFVAATASFAFKFPNTYRELLKVLGAVWVLVVVAFIAYSIGSRSGEPTPLLPTLAYMALAAIVAVGFLLLKRATSMFD